MSASAPVRLLLIDDEEIVLESCVEILRGQPYEVATARDGKRGLALLRDFHPDVVVVDLKMPGLSGFDVLDRIREADPTIVTLVMTGYATVQSAVDAMKAGAYDFLPKPFTPDEFRLIVRRSAEKRALVLETIALRRERELIREHFASIVSHELKAPLAAVQQNVFVLEAELKDAGNADQVTRIGRVKARIGDLLQIIETWRRGVSVDIEAIRSRRTAVPLAAPVAKAVESLADPAARKEIALAVTVPEPSPVVWGDEGTLTQTLVNILGNAVKFSRVGGRVAVEVMAAGAEATITIADNGVGIAPEDLPLVFDAFYSARPGEGGERGSGLGLAISRRIIDAHDGSILVRSTPGTGSTFVITLPLHNDGGPDAARPGAEHPADSAKEGRR